jgi:hypothetical protein
MKFSIQIPMLKPELATLKWPDFVIEYYDDNDDGFLKFLDNKILFQFGNH